MVFLFCFDNVDRFKESGSHNEIHSKCKFIKVCKKYWIRVQQNSLNTKEIWINAKLEFF